MVMVATAAFLLLLFLLLYVCWYRLLQVTVSQTAARYRLHHVQHHSVANRLSRFVARYGWLYRHLAELLEIVQVRLRVGSFVCLSVLLGMTGIVIGFVTVPSLKGVAALALMLGLLPYLVVRSKLISLQMKTRLAFLPAVELFYQYYLATGHGNIRTALKVTLEEDRLPPSMKQVFEQLYRNLATSRGVEESLRMFARSVGHVWGDYFANIVQVGLQEGCTIQDSLKELIGDMRRSQRSDQADRNRLLEIRLANFSPLLFLVLFLGINVYMDAAQAYLYYVVDMEGRTMLLDGLLLIFASFLMGVYLSIRRI